MDPQSTKCLSKYLPILPLFYLMYFTPKCSYIAGTTIFMPLESHVSCSIGLLAVNIIYILLLG